MGTEAAKKLPSPSDIKVHSVMCTELFKLVYRVDQIFPEIEASKPRCSSGIESLCLLIDCIEKAKLLIQDCCDSSILYLALTGNAVLSKCKKLKNLLEQNLNRIQNMVPVMLAAKISRIIEELRVVKFRFNPLEEEAGKAVRSLLEGYRTGDCSEKDGEWIQIAAQKLQITSSKALLLEKRSIKKLLGQLDEGSNKQKKQILSFILHLLNKYGKSITAAHIENDNNVQNQDYKSQTVDFQVDHEKDMSGTPPEEFKCSISHKVMYDPVVIDSDEMFERMWIQKWLDEGHDTCPKTNKKLSNHSMTPNSAMKGQISNWCETNGITVPDPFMQVSNDVNAWEYSASSFNSLSSMYSLQLPVDYSNLSLSSLENSRVIEDIPEYDDDLSKEIDDALPWEFQCKFVEDLMTRLKNDDRACKLISCKNLVGSLVRFLKLARDINDATAQRIGCLLLQILVTKCSSRIQYLSKDAYQLVAEFLDSEVREEALAITEELSSRKSWRSEIASSDLIPKLVTLSEDDSLSRYCIAILSNLCGSQENKNIIAETKGCISFVARVLDSGNREEQEHALEILLSLCSQSMKYCRLVMEEDVILSLVLISSNGSDKGKAKAHEMLRLLGDTKI